MNGKNPPLLSEETTSASSGCYNRKGRGQPGPRMFPRDTQREWDVARFRALRVQLSRTVLGRGVRNPDTFVYESVPSSESVPL